MYIPRLYVKKLEELECILFKVAWAEAGDLKMSTSFQAQSPDANTQTGF